jgi:GntR family transcriptional regulator
VITAGAEKAREGSAVPAHGRKPNTIKAHSRYHTPQRTTDAERSRPVTTISESPINRHSAVPYYQQLARTLEGRIATGVIARGEKLPSENELSTEFRLSRATVRQALQFLESRGAAQRIPNRGVFASEPPDGTGWVIQSKEGFLENAMGHQNRSVSTQVLRSGSIALPTEACRALELADGAHGFELVRLRSLEGTPALFSTNYSPPILVPTLAGATDVLAGREALTPLLAGAGFTMAGANRIIRAAHPTPEIAAALQISDAEPLLRIRSISWTSEGLRYDMYETWVRSDVIPLEVSVNSVDLNAVR